MLLQESRNDIRAKGERHAAVVFTPTRNVFVRVGPEQIAEQAAIRNLSESAAAENTTASTSDGISVIRVEGIGQNVHPSAA